MKASASILIKQNVVNTFNAFSDVPNRQKYLPTITKLKINSLHDNGKGTEWHEERIVDGISKKGSLEISTYNKPKSMVTTTHTAGLIFKTRYNFQYAGPKATKVVVTIGGNPKGILSGIMDKFLSQNSLYMGQQLQNDLDAFKKVLDKGLVTNE
jgi:uncharacterized membrane protein